MGAVGVYRAIRINWTNPAALDLARVQVWSSTTNDRTTAVLIASPAATPGVGQTYLNANLTPGTTRYYWIRAQDRSNNVSAWTPTSPTAGWVATATGIPMGDVTGGMLAWVEVTTTTHAMAVDTGYLVNVATLCTLTLPATAGLFTALKVIGRGAGGWRLAQNAGQQIRFGVMQSTVGVTGYAQSGNRDDAVSLICSQADTLWTPDGFQGLVTLH